MISSTQHHLDIIADKEQEIVSLRKELQRVQKERRDVQTKLSRVQTELDRYKPKPYSQMTPEERLESARLMKVAFPPNPPAVKQDGRERE